MDKLLKRAVEVQKTFRGFILAGGTAIMFKYNHRQSIDLDFFKEKPFSFNRLATKIRNHFVTENEERGSDNLDFFIEGVKVSFVYFPFRPVKPAQRVKDVTIYSDYDLFLNKLYVAGRRVDPKDPFDAAWLYKQNQWNTIDIKKDFEKKFPDQSFELYLGALLSFDDYGTLDQDVKNTLLKLRNT